MLKDLKGISLFTRFFTVVDNVFVVALDLSSATVEKNLRLTQRVNQLTVDLQVWKDSRSKAVETAERDEKQHEQEKVTLQRRINILESMQVRMICG